MFQLQNVPSLIAKAEDHGNYEFAINHQFRSIKILTLLHSGANLLFCVRIYERVVHEAVVTQSEW